MNSKHFFIFISFHHSCKNKIEVKNYVKYTLNEELYPKTLKIYNNADEINLNDLPDKFVLKTNNACAHNIFCLDKKTFDLEKAKEKLNIWVNRIAGEISAEYQYCKINRKIFAEEILEHEGELLDYRFWCFNGKPYFLHHFAYYLLRQVCEQNS